MNIDSVPSNPLGGKTLIVDCSGQNKYMLPSEAIHDMGESDQVYVRPGIYEDKIFVSQRPIRLVGAGRDLVQIFHGAEALFTYKKCRKGGLPVSRSAMSVVISTQPSTSSTLPVRLGTVELWKEFCLGWFCMVLSAVRHWSTMKCVGTVNQAFLYLPEPIRE